MRTGLLLLVAMTLSSVCFSQPRWYNDYTSLTSGSDIRSNVIGLDNATSLMLSGPSVAKLDINGDVLWQKKLVGIGAFFNGEVLSDGTVILVGKGQENFPQGNLDTVLLFNIDQDGEVLWSKELLHDSKSVGGLCVKSVGDSCLYIGGWRSDEQEGVDELNALMLKTSLLGEPISAVSFDVQMSVYDFEVTEDGGVVGAGCLFQNDVSDLETGALSYFGVDANFSSPWWRTADFGEGTSSAVGVEKWGDEYVIAGTVDESDLVLLEVTEEGNFFQNARYNGVDDFQARRLTRLNSNEFMILADQYHNSDGGGIVYVNPVTLSTFNLAQIQLATMFVNGEETDRYAVGCNPLTDGSYALSTRAGELIECYKLFPNEVLPDCALGQPNLTVTMNELTPEPVAGITSTSLELSQVTAPALNAFTSDQANHCGGSYCDFEVNVLSNAPVQCGGSLFEFFTNTEGIMSYAWYFDDELMSNEAEFEITIEEFGFYEVRLEIISENYCPAFDILNVTAQLTPEPELTVADTVAICEGETLQISTTEDYNFYQWSNASIQPTINTPLAGEFWVTVTGENGCQATSDTTTVLLGEIPMPFVELTGDTLFCADESVTIGTQEFAEYEWTFDQDVQSFETSMPGPYFVHVITDLGCEGQSDTLWIDTLAVPTPVVLADGPLSWCLTDGQTVGLGANDAYENVIWSNNVSDSSITVSNSGIYSYTATAFNGCVALSDTVFVIAWLDPVITFEEIMDSAGEDCVGSAEISVLAETATYTIEWSGDPAEESETVQFLCPGDQTVTVTDENGCSTTESFNIGTGENVEELEAAGIRIYPNPVADVLNIQTVNDIPRLTLVDSRGRVVLDIVNPSRLDLSQFESGLYQLTFWMADGPITAGVLKK